MVAAQSAVNNLRRFLQRREDSGTADDGLEAYSEEICDAVGKIKVVSWEAIHRERFPLTPTAIYAEMCKNAQVLLQRQGADAFRRSARLALVEEEEEASQDEPDAPHPGLKPLRYTEVNGPDLEVFKMKQASKPPGWNRAVAQALYPRVL